MWDTRKIINKQNGAGVAGLTVEIREYSSSSPYYTSTVLHTYTDMGAGVYGKDITTTIKGTLVINRGSTTVCPSNFVGYVFNGDDNIAVGG